MTYWNHNVAFHPWVVRHAHGRVLDVGCGDGLLIGKLRPRVDEVVGLDPNPAVEGPHIITGGFESLPVRPSFDTLVFVASLHHMDTRVALRRARSILRPGGTLLVVGLSKYASALDWIVSGLNVPIARIGSWIHGGVHEPPVTLADPNESFAEIRRIAREVLPGARMRRALYFRYLLRWHKPSEGDGIVNN